MTTKPKPKTYTYHQADSRSVLFYDHDRTSSETTSSSAANFHYNGPTIQGRNPGQLFDKAVRERVGRSTYWKDLCFSMNEATICDQAVRLRSVGGTVGEMGASPFLCLLLKMCALAPDRLTAEYYLNFCEAEHLALLQDDEDTAEKSGDEEEHNKKEVENIKAEDKGEFKYLRALAAFYIRLAWEPVEVYKTLEPLLRDKRKLRRQTRDGFVLTYMDEFIDDLLKKERVCGVNMKKLPKRETLEDLDLLDPIEEIDVDEDEDEEEREEERDFQDGSNESNPSDSGFDAESK